MLLRRADEADLASILRLLRELNPEDPALSIEVAIANWRAMLAQSGLAVYVVELDGNLVATCTLLVVPNLTRNARPYALIENVVTLSAYREQGYARAVLQFALTQAWQANCYKVMLSTSARSKGVLEFYRRCGFVDGIKTGFVAVPS
jgi:GNAT superfamily N-acetyltransferase